jgi:PTH1 family peptidyl-tRNA hydrolase
MAIKMKIIIGLGNPDEEYYETRHNVGFMMLDYLAKKYDGDEFTLEKKLNALATKVKIEKVSAILVKPLTYVNKSGETAGKAKNYYKVKPEDIVLIHDDLDIEFGNTKLSFDKNSGGHKGVESVMRGLKTKKFWRLRIGTANNALKKAHKLSEKKKDEAVVDFVLGRFSKKEKDQFKDVFKESLQKLLQAIN